MTEGDISTIAGWVLVSATATVTVFASVIEECLRMYHRADLFEGLPESRRARFDELLRREADYFLAARLGRLVALAIFLAATLLLLSKPETPLDFGLDELITATLITVALGILGAGIAPAIWARNWAEPTLRRFLPAFNALTIPLRPLVMVINLLERGVARVAGEEVEETPEQEFEDDIADHLDEAARDGVIGEGERQMIDSIIEFARDTVRDTMTPRTDMIVVDVGESVDRAVEIANANGHSRLPVCEGGRDRIIGIFNVRDAMALWANRNGAMPSLRELIRAPAFVPETKRLSALLAEFKSNKTHIAVVLDEFGGTSGMVTLEDVLEEIVGDIRDEHDHTEEDTSVDHKTLEGSVGGETLIDARMKVDDFNLALATELPESPDYTSIGGLISARTGRIPDLGEEIAIDGLVFRVVEANERAVKRVSVKRAEAQSATPE